MHEPTGRISVSLRPDAMKALNHIKDQCNPDMRALTSRIVSAAIVQLYEQSIAQNLQLDIHFRPIPGCFIKPDAVAVASPTPSAWPTLRLV